MKKYQKDYGIKNKLKKLQQIKLDKENNPEKYKKRNKDQYENLKSQMPFIKDQVFRYYSNEKMCCLCCGESEFAFLTIDHINGRKSVGHTHEVSGIRLYKWLFSHNFPDGYQVLCMNCNFAKGIYGICPHQTNLK